MDQNLLLYGLGELSYWRSWEVSRHLARCPHCRKRRAELAAASARMAAALRRPGGLPRAVRLPVTIAQGWLMIASLSMLIGLSLFTLWFAVHHHPLWRAPAHRTDYPCRPDLPNDRCR